MKYHIHCIFSMKSFCKIALSFLLFIYPRISFFAETKIQHEPLESGYFLLPSPIPENSNEMILLFTAPVLDGFILEEHAEKYEKKSRSILKNKYEQIYQYLCKQDENERKNAISVYMDQINREYGIWEKLALKYDENMNLRIDSEFKNTPYRELIPDWKEKYKTVSDLRMERQKILANSWKFFFKSAGKQKFCKQNSSETDYTPGERLFLPLYIAMYRFYEGIPADYRTKLIFSYD